MSRWLLPSLAVLVCVGCASRSLVEDVAETRYNLNQHRQMLRSESTGAAGEIQPYTLAPTESFRMPEALESGDPVLPEQYLVQRLPATTVCVNVMIDAQGHVQGTAPLLTHSQCGAGAEQGNAPLLQAALKATAGWRFVPAARCHFAIGSRPAAADDCTGAAQVEPVPVTLSYAFTFEVEQGRATVRSQGGLR